MTVTAVLLAHYKERDKENIEIIVRDSTASQGAARQDHCV
jgi:hypothetical protein